MAFGATTHWYTSSAKWSAVTAWSAGAAKTVGQLVRQSATPTAGNERVFVCVIAGTTHATTEPTWTVTRGAKVTDNTVTWQEVTGIAALNGDLTNTPTWAASRAVSTNATLGHVIKDAAGTHIFICDSGGTVGAAEPTWGTGAVGNTTTDNGVTWRYLGTSFSAWAAPHKALNNALATNWGDTGVKFYVGHAHAHSVAASISYTSRGTVSAPIDWVCVNEAGSMPPVAADVATGASETATGASNITINGALRICHGISFIAGTSSNPSVTTSGDTKQKFFQDCAFALGSGVGASGNISFGIQDGFAEYVNCTLKFSNSSQAMLMRGRVIWRDTPSAFDTSLVTPVSYMTNLGDRADILVKNVDLSAYSTTLVSGGGTVMATITFLDCKLHASVTVCGSGLLTNSVGMGATKVQLLRSNNAAVNYRLAKYTYAGTLVHSTEAVRTNGATDLSTPISWKLTTGANANFNLPFDTFPIVAWNPTISSNVTVTVEGVINAAAVPTDAQVWIDVSYQGSASDGGGTTKSSRVANVLSTPANLTASSAAWDSGATARQNTHVYTGGDVIKLASNPGRLFFCITGGTSSGSEPGGYATAVDGDSIPDGGATFRAGCRFKMAVTLTSPSPQIAGLLIATVRAAVASASMYVDPYLTLS